jgi:DNA-binding CsgD family transcriptional regulator
MPGTVPRGSLPVVDGKGFSPLTRFILDKLDRGVVLLDAAGAIIDANTLAQQVLREEKGLQNRGGRLAFTDVDVDARFARLLDATHDVAGARRSLAASVKCPGAASYRVLIGPAHHHGARRNVAFVAVLYGPEESREISAEVLAELYGLTPAQADVARRLYAGHSVEETAMQLRLSLNTVRTHLKQIFSKCEVRSQAELLRMLATGPRAL